MLSKKTYTDKNGYKRFKDSNKYVHRWVVEKRVERKLTSDEVVHHKNRNKSDNRPSNLYGYLGKDGRKKHSETHKKDGW